MKPRSRKYVGKTVPTEHQEQAELFNQLRLRLKDHPELGLAYAIPNGTRTSIHVARRMKAEGVKTGVPDICLPMGWGGYFGLYIELKARPFRDEDGRLHRQRLSKEQAAWCEELEGQGYLVKRTEGWQEALVAIVAYVKLEPTQRHVSEDRGR
jgi:hypothetical protein